MNQVLASWITPVAAVVLLAGAVEVFLPGDVARGYARAILGLIVLLAVLHPLITWLHGEPNFEALTQEATLPSSATMASRSGTDAAYEVLVADEATTVVRAEPGGQGALVTVWFSPTLEPSGEPSVTGAVIRVGEGATAVEQDAMRSVLASDLGIGASAIRLQ